MKKLCITKKDLVKTHCNSSYINSVRVLLQNLNDHKSDLNPYKIPLIITAAAALETILNEAIIVECRYRFPMKHIKRITNANLSMSLGSKLDNLGWIFTDNSFITNNESKLYTTLKDLIKLRNKIMHSKEYYKSIEFEVFEDERSNPKEKWIKLDETYDDLITPFIDKMNNEKFDKIYHAIVNLEKAIISITSKPSVVEKDFFIKND